MVWLITCKLFLANLLEKAKSVLTSSRSPLSNTHHWGQLAADVIHINLQERQLAFTITCQEEYQASPVSLLSYKLSLLHSVFDQVLSILRALIQPSRRTGVAAARTEKSWAVDPRHGVVGALRFECWAPVEAWRSVLIHDGNWTTSISINSTSSNFAIPRAGASKEERRKRYWREENLLRL